MKVAVIGAGLIGRLTALECSRRNWQVTIFDERGRGENTSCSFTAAGLLSPYCELAHAQTIIHHLGMRSLLLWNDLIDRLDLPVFFQRQGTLVVSPTSEFGELRHFIDRITRKLAKLSLSSHGLETVTQAQMQQIEPAIDSTRFSGVFMSDEGQIDGRRILTAMQDELLERGVIWKDHAPVQLAPNLVTTSNDTHTFEHVFDCRGLGAKSSETNLRGVRGELIVVRAPSVELTRPIRMLHSRFPLYVAPRPESIYILGASEIESESLDGISVQSTLELLSSAAALHGGFLDATIVETRVNCRPAFDDNLPRVRLQQGLTAINGLYRHGFLCGPATVDIAVSLAAGDEIDSSFASICQVNESIHDKSPVGAEK